MANALITRKGGSSKLTGEKLAESGGGGSNGWGHVLIVGILSGGVIKYLKRLANTLNRGC